MTRSFLQWLDQWLATIQSIGNPWAVTVVCCGLLCFAARAGLFNVSLSRFAEIRATRDEWGAFRFASWHALTDSICFGLLTVPVVLWGKWWLTGPAAVLYAAIVLPTILQDIVFVFASLGMIVMKPRRLVPILAGTCAKLAGDALMIVYLALVVRAFWT